MSIYPAAEGKKVSSLLWAINQALEAYATYRLAGGINLLAHQALVSRRVRARALK